MSKSRTISLASVLSLQRHTIREHREKSGGRGAGIEERKTEKDRKKEKGGQRVLGGKWEWNESAIAMQAFSVFLSSSSLLRPLLTPLVCNPLEPGPESKRTEEDRTKQNS